VVPLALHSKHLTMGAPQTGHLKATYSPGPTSRPQEMHRLVIMGRLVFVKF